ncbi:MAG: metallophosphoesterase [Clostridia bacterium]|nr:metallophosphoesterase [Clostridia bacterium]
MNRRPQQSRRSYDDFSPRHTTRFHATQPDTRFFDARRKRSGFFVFLSSAALFLVAALVLNFALNFFIHVEHISVPVTGLKEAFTDYTLLHISDLKGATFGGNQSRLSLALGDDQFDAVLLTGDMVSPLGNAEPLYDLIEALKADHPRTPIYFIAGDSDPEPVSMIHASNGSPFAPWVLGAQQRGAIWLNAPEAITRDSQSIWFCTTAQLSLDMDTMQPQYEQHYLNALDSGNQNAIELATHNLKQLEKTRAARKAMSSSDVYIALSHVPPMQEELTGQVTSQIDLLLCGHYLGGLIRLPFAGPVFIPSLDAPLYGLFPGDGMRRGLTRTGRTYVYTSPGLGSGDELYPPFFFRLFNPPTVSLISLTPSSL